MKTIHCVLLGLFVMAQSCTTLPGKVEINGHHFIDLGLPSGLLWAETNIGASSAADPGDYFAWGETKPKTNYSWDTYTHGTAEDSLYKYCAADAKDKLDAEDDAATVNWGSGCRMPTHTEFAELADTTNCSWQWTTQPASDGTMVNGYLITGKRNGNSIFLPACGCRDEETLINKNSNGYYWSDTLNALYAYYANFLSLDNDCSFMGHDYRYYGLPIRPVATVKE